MNYHRISSPPVKVYWAGWESDTFRLQRAGWQLSEYREFDLSMGYRLAMSHPRYGVRGITSENRDLYEEYIRMMNYDSINRIKDLPPFNVDMMGTDIKVQAIYQSAVPDMAFSDKWTPIDANPMHVMDCKLSEIVPFRPIGGEEIIVAPDTVPGLLEKILELQDPKQKEIREKARKEARRQGKVEIDPAMNCHAQIISFVR